MNIKGKKVTLRAMEKQDCEMVREMFNDPEIENLVVGWAFPVSSYAQEKWFETHYIENYDVKDLDAAYAKRLLNELESLLDKLGWAKE